MRKRVSIRIKIKSQVDESSMSMFRLRGRSIIRPQWVVRICKRSQVIIFSVIPMAM